MPMIIETVVTTRSLSGDVHIAPLGLIAHEGGWIIAPFKPSKTLDNLRENPCAVANHIDDVRVIAGCLTGRRAFQLRRAQKVDCGVLADALTHWEMKVERVEEDEQRPRFFCQMVYEVAHGPWGGFNRAQAAVIEAAVLVSRLKMLPAEKVESELAYLKIAVDKTAGPRELEAWGWLMEKVDAWRAGGQ